jgi:hypothetical protein
MKKEKPPAVRTILLGVGRVVVAFDTEHMPMSEMSDAADRALEGLDSLDPSDPRHGEINAWLGRLRSAAVELQAEGAAHAARLARFTEAFTELRREAIERLRPLLVAFFGDRAEFVARHLRVVRILEEAVASVTSLRPDTLGGFRSVAARVANLHEQLGASVRAIETTGR